MYLGVANTMANIQNEWWIPRLMSKVKKVINRYNTCKVFSTKPYGSTTTAAMPRFWAEEEGETTGPLSLVHLTTKSPRRREANVTS